jgi:hypothetical protein
MLILLALGLPASPELLTELIYGAPHLLLLQADLPHGSLLTGPLGLRYPPDLPNDLQPERVPL